MNTFLKKSAVRFKISVWISGWCRKRSSSGMEALQVSNTEAKLSTKKGKGETGRILAGFVKL